jgi:tetratricopeptide (TPR) repeat protein
MTTPLTCPQGHQWPAGAVPGSVCPTCGAEAVRVSPEPTPAEESATLRPSEVPPRVPPLPEARTWLTAAAPDAELPAVAGYEILGVLGRGGMGVVYRARHLGLKRLVALKMIVSGAQAGREQRARFRKEAEAVARLQHPNVVQIFEVGEQDGLPFFALELAAGGSLAAWLDGKPRPARQAAAWTEVLARATDHAHRHGIVHRDLKPANVLLAGEDRPDPLAAPLLKVTDFGLAKRLEGEVSQTQPGAVVGTPSYMAPEQAGGGKGVGPAADTYALGAILYELLTGRPPFLAETLLETVLQVQTEEPVPPRRLNPAVPHDLETVCLKCLQKQPGQRYASAGDLADDLARFLRDEPVVARPPSVLYRFGKFARRHKAQVAGVAGIFLALVLGLAGTLAGLARARAGQTQAQAAERETRRLLAASYQQAAELAMRRGAWREALDNVERALDAAREAGLPDPVSLHLARVKAWAALDEGPKATEELNQLAARKDLGELEGSVLLWRADLALCLASDDEQALAQVAEAARKGLPPAEAAYAAGLLAETSPEAVTAFRRALDADPFHQRANGMLVLLLTFLGRFGEARDRIAFAEQVFPDDPTFPVLRAQIAALEDDLPAAHALVERAPQLSPRQRETARALVEIFWQLRRMEGALGDDPGADLLPLLLKVQTAALKLHALQQDPEGVPGEANVVRVGLLFPVPPVLVKAFRRVPPLALPWALGDADGVSRALADLTRVHPDGLFYLARGNALTGAGRLAEADEFFLQAADVPSFVPVARPALLHAIQCEWRLATGMKVSPEAARQNGFFKVRGQLGGALAAAPGEPLQALPGLLLGTERWADRALRHVRRFITLYRVRPDEAYYLATVAMGMGDLDLARWVVSAWEQQAPDDPNALAKRAVVELKGGAFGRAVEAADRLAAVAAELPDDKQGPFFRKKALECREAAIEQSRQPLK